MGQRLGGEQRERRARAGSGRWPPPRSAPGSRATCPTRCPRRRRPSGRRGPARWPRPGGSRAARAGARRSPSGSGRVSSACRAARAGSVCRWTRRLGPRSVADAGVGVVGPIALGGQVAEHVGDGRPREGAELDRGGRPWRGDERTPIATTDDRAVVPACDPRGSVGSAGGPGGAGGGAATAGRSPGRPATSTSPPPRGCASGSCRWSPAVSRASSSTSQAVDFVDSTGLGRDRRPAEAHPQPGRRPSPRVHPPQPAEDPRAHRASTEPCRWPRTVDEAARRAGGADRGGAHDPPADPAPQRPPRPRAPRRVHRGRGRRRAPRSPHRRPEPRGVRGVRQRHRRAARHRRRRSGRDPHRARRRRRWPSPSPTTPAGFSPDDVDPLPSVEDPGRLRHEHGLGLPLIRSLSESVTFAPHRRRHRGADRGAPRRTNRRRISADRQVWKPRTAGYRGGHDSCDLVLVIEIATVVT